MTDRLTIAEFNALKKKKPKYGNKKAEHNGITFHSIKERDRYKDLLLMEQAGEIAHLQRQVMFPLHVAGRLVCSYIADFVYVDLKLGRQVVEDSKGMRTKDYRIKAKLYAALHEHPILET